MTQTINKLAYIAKPYIGKISDELQEVFTKDLGSLISNHEKYKEAFRALSIFLVRVSRLSNGILDLVASDNLYSANVLLRALIEHAFKIEFLVEKSLKENNDNIYKEYFLFCDLSEELQYQKSLDFKKQKLEDIQIDEEAYQELLNRRPDLKKFTKNQINDKANQFTFRNIFRFLNDRQHDDKLLDEDLKVYYGAYLHTGAIYSDLSSFVHGGPFADNFEFRMHLSEEEHNKEIFTIVENVMVMHFAPFLVTCSFISKLDKKYDEKIKTMVEIQMDYYNKI